METVLRVAITYVFILVALRLLGKREFGQLTPLELVSLMLIPELVSQSLVREDFSMTNGLVGISTLLVLVFLTSLATTHSTKAATVIESEPTVLVHGGRFLEHNLRQQRVAPDEVMSQLREAGLERLDQVRWAILETDGRISIVPTDGEGTPANQDAPPPVL
jgi:uncharacterized membrane protein YcaP (DUF421 family)